MAYFLILCVCLPLIYAKNCNVLDYGAKGDGHTNDTKAIQDAIDSCYDSNSNELNTVLFPSNHIFMIYPISFTHNNCQLIIDSNTSLNAISNINAWPITSHSSIYIPIISAASHINTISIKGMDGKTSIINGNGAIWWEIYINKTLKHQRPKLIDIIKAENIEISDLTLINSPSFHINIMESNNVSIHGINISSPNAKIAPNTDGIDIGATNVHVYDCYISNGDDTYTLKPGANNVLFENSTAAYPGNGLVVGTGGNISNSVYRNMIVEGTQHGIHLKAKGNEQNGTQQNITFDNIQFVNVLSGIDLNSFNQTYDIDDNLQWVTIQDITINNVYGTYQEDAGHIDCPQQYPCHGLTFENINMLGVFTQSKGWQCSDNVYGTVKNVTPPLKCLHDD